MTKIDFCADTHAGSRELNEDSYLSLPDYGVWAIADGMGGHGSGDMASQIAVLEIERLIKQGNSLTQAITSAHQAIQKAALSGDGQGDMGTTVVAVKLDGLNYEIAWVGDSRAYLWNGALHQLTTDHSYVQLLLNKGMITPAEALTYPGRNIVVQALGVGGMNKAAINIEQVFGKLNQGDSLLLCSDGLSGEISDEVIAASMLEKSNNQSKVNCLIGSALTAGSKDNITVILVTIVAPENRTIV
jgi:serine/threonine protein phosphatase PrpC